jgi:hypothetical protein
MIVVAIAFKKCYIIHACMKYIEGVKHIMNQMKIFRKLAILLFVTASILTLAACSRGDKTPWGDISSETVYLTLGDITITERDLYEQLRLQGASILSTMFDEKLFADEIATVKAVLADPNHDDFESLNTFLDETINGAIHGTSDLEQLERLYTQNFERFARNVEQFVDSLYLLDNEVNIDQIVDAILDLSLAGENGYTNYSSIPQLVTRYELRAAQRIYAQNILKDEVTDEDSSVFISDDNIVTFYNNNRKGRFDVEALVIRFINLNEANAALYQASIKSDARGNWYQIPDIRVMPGEQGYVDLDLVDYGHVKDLLDELNLLDKIDVNNDDTFVGRDLISVQDYENYYRRYVINTTRDIIEQRDSAMDDRTVQLAFINIYNMLNPANAITLNVDDELVLAGDPTVAFDTTFTYDDLTKMNTTLRNHVYNTLVVPTSGDDEDEDEETTVTGKPYSGRIQTFGASRFLVFKFGDDSVSEEGILIADPEDEDKEIFADTVEAKAIYDDIYAEILKSRLTSDYITTKVNEKYEDLTVDILDPVVRAFYEQQFGYDGTTKDEDGAVVARLGDIEVTVREFYTRLEKSYGINLALDIVSNKFLVQHPDYNISDSDKTDYEEQFKDIIRQFSADQFASAGFPASMGRDKFLLLAFGVTTNAEAVNQLYIYPDLRQQYIEDRDNHYNFENYTIYEKLAHLAAKQHEFFTSMNVSHLLVYFDENGDGQPDNPQEYLDKLSPQGRQDVLDGLAELVQLLYDMVGQYRGHAEALTSLANEFNSSGRIEIGSRVPPFDFRVEQIWHEYRQLGFNLKFENLPNAITNTSNFVTGSSVLDTVFYNRAIELHDHLVSLPDDDSKLPFLDLYDDYMFNRVDWDNELANVQSSFGWHLILTTSTRKPASAVYSASNDEDGRYVSDDEERNVYNEDSETLTASQIEFYLIEQDSPEGVVLPSAVQTAVTTFLDPILTRYENTFMQRELIFMLLKEVGFTSANNQVRFDTIREINRRQLNEYMISSGRGLFDQNYANLYADWFTILEATERPAVDE